MGQTTSRSRWGSTSAASCGAGGSLRRRSSSRSRSRVAGSSSGHTTYRAQTLISLGTPFTATGGAAITSAFCTSPVAPATLIKQDAIREAAERQAGLRPGALKGHVSSQPVPGRRHEAQLHPGGQHHRAGAVQGRRRRPDAANALAARRAARPAASTRSAPADDAVAGSTASSRSRPIAHRRLDQAQTLLDKMQADNVALGDRTGCWPPRSPATRSRTSSSARTSSTSSSATTSRCSSRSVTSS